MKRLAVAFAAMVALTTAVSAQDFPNKKVSFVVPYPPGIAIDTLGRIIADGLAKVWAQPVVVENRSGANGIIGTSYAARQPADGYTLMFTSAAYAMNPAIQPTDAFNPSTDLTAAAIIGTGDYMYVFGNHVPGDKAQDFIAAARKQEMKWASTGAGAEFAARLLMEATGINMKRVPYRGNNEAITEMLAGRMDFIISGPGAMAGFLQEKQLKAFAVTGKSRSRLLPDVPTLEQSGIQNANLEAWWGVFVSSKTPPDIIVKINEAINKVLELPEVRAALESQDVTITRNSAKDANDLVQRELARFREIAVKNNIKLD